MQSIERRPPLVVIVGPTAVGKTEISIQLAQRLNAEIVSADSRLFYRGMNIGTAKPGMAERQGIPHHLIDVADPGEVWSLSVFQKEAGRAIAEILSREKIPFLVGGTGQYIKAVTEGWQIPAGKPDDRLRTLLNLWADQIGKDGLHQRLAIVDPDAAALIDARNLRRTVRALEVILTTGKRFSEQRLQSPSPFRILMIGLDRPRSELYQRVDARIELMLADGWVEEVKALLAQGCSPESPVFSAIGYREIAEYLNGQTTFEDAILKIKQLTRRFVRHQGAWFSRNDPAIHWFEVRENVVEDIDRCVREFLKENCP